MLLMVTVLSLNKMAFGVERYKKTYSLVLLIYDTVKDIICKQQNLNIIFELEELHRVHIWDRFLEHSLRFFPEDANARGGALMIIGFADDALIIVERENEQILEERMDTSIRRVQTWLRGKQLQMAVPEVEAVLFTKRRVYRMTRLINDESEIQWKNQLANLEVELDMGLVGFVYTRSKKVASRTAGYLARLMPIL